MKNILLTGGSGYIGSHTCIPLLEKGYKITVIDSNINSSDLSIERIKKILRKDSHKKNISFLKGDLRDKLFLNKVFLKAKEENTPFEGVIHFAGLKSVSESFLKPLLYWENNVYGSICLIEIMRKFDCRNIVFSSSASIYGNTTSQAILETSEVKPCTPYAHTKVAIENILEATFQSSKGSWGIANLRYFNPIGAHETGLIGESPLNIPNNLFPIMCKVANQKKKRLQIFGNDWPTNDGTCVRDYIHIMDLADAHCSALDYLLENKPQIINLNIGTGIGTSVLELVKIFMRVTSCNLPYEFCARRIGDSPYVVANNKQASSTLNWSPKRDLDQMCKDGWNWQKNNPYGFV